ncbi:MAG TPA: efflux transporter outer membrane subunit [Steroidobacteraceae bacterium]|nr:efflux transporter outer membrane subunit [Steroidobacteraceae bacterium]
MRTQNLVAAAAAAAVLCACTLQPPYHRPSSGAGNLWPTGPAYAQQPVSSAEMPAADVGWQEFFSDPQLRELIGIALQNNRDLRVAALNIEQAQAQYRVQRSALFPGISASGSDSVEHLPPGVAIGVVPAGAPNGVTFRTYSAGLGFASYILDVFGRVRSLSRSALEQYFAQIETRKSVQISLVAEVADAYLSYLSDRSLLALAQQTYTSQNASLNLTQQSFNAGVGTALDLAQSQQTVYTAQANIAQFTRQVAQDLNGLQLVLGAALPPDLDQAPGLNGEQFLETLPAGLPSDLLTRRPDIAAAEDKLKAANANIGAARAAFFPSITLTGSLGSASTQLSGLLGHGSQEWTFEPSISLPIFAGGANVANLDLARVEKNVAIAQYQETIQTAFRDVSNALAARGTFEQQILAEEHLVDAANMAYQLSLQLFRQGVANFLSVLDSQVTLYQAQQTLIAIRLARLQNLVALYTALGGGWNARTVRPVATAGQLPTSKIAGEAAD